eukprot:TRINITY_DN5450_c0_g1_i1.p1 TRINITY_DN5450_c0_g1~~TRINITY_DN5450_c0_g1_i1.p1  ORF type:complete len:384 (-),score=105.37 TRINITY_DN5450_c0_g1_i1:453-1604(-)
MASAAACPSGSVELRRVFTSDDPERLSFWRDVVVYPYEVHEAVVRGWRIAYMDVAPAAAAAAKGTLVVVHGKGACAAHYSGLLAAASAAGWRVIAPDLPHYGKSLNPGMPFTRSLHLTRELLHELIVERLGVRTAAYYGHSLGGLWAIGYALDYPGAVSCLVLEAPAGLEEFPAATAAALRDAWAVDATAEWAKSPQLLRDFYWSRRTALAPAPDGQRLAEAAVPAQQGYFLCGAAPSPDAEILAAARIGLSTAASYPPAAQCQRELADWSAIYVRDKYSIVSELIEGDPLSIRAQAVSGKLKTPVAILFGEEEPFIPMQASTATHKLSLRKDTVEPFVAELRKQGVPVRAVFYPGCGHFPHADRPAQFSADVLAFLDEFGHM